MKKSRRPQKKQKKRQGTEALVSASPASGENAIEGEIVSTGATAATAATAGASAPAAAAAGTAGTPAPAMAPARVGAVTFFRQVRAEMARVTWPTRNETIVTTALVFVMVALAAIFFLLADQVLSFFISWILGAR